MPLTPEAAEARDLLNQIFFTPAQADPYPAYERLRELGSVHPSPLGYVAVSYDACNALLRDKRVRSLRWSTSVRGEGSPSQESGDRWVISLDPPDHTRLRSLLTKAFTPAVVEELRPYVRSFVATALAGADEGGDSDEFDLIGDLAFPLPITVIGELIGIPAGDRDQFREWTLAIFRIGGIPIVPDDLRRAADEATIASETYLRELAARRRASPTDDLISRMLAVREGSDRLREDEIVSNLNFLVMAGFQTTVYTIGNSVSALLSHPDQLALLRDDPSLLATAGEELLRYDPPVQWAVRMVAEDMEVAGTHIPAGTPLAVVLGSANRDPAHFSDADRLDLRRADPRGLTFGSGIHYCIGAALARLELQEAVAGLLERYDTLEIAGPPERADAVVMRGFARLPLRGRCRVWPPAGPGLAMPPERSRPTSPVGGILR